MLHSTNKHHLWSNNVRVEKFLLYGTCNKKCVTTFCLLQILQLLNYLTSIYYLFVDSIVHSFFDYDLIPIFYLYILLYVLHFIIVDILHSTFFLHVVDAFFYFNSLFDFNFHLTIKYSFKIFILQLIFSFSGWKPSTYLFIPQTLYLYHTHIIISPLFNFNSFLHSLFNISSLFVHSSLKMEIHLSIIFLFKTINTSFVTDRKRPIKYQKIPLSDEPISPL